jgi:hypothetical protein
MEGSQTTGGRKVRRVLNQLEAQLRDYIRLDHAAILDRNEPAKTMEEAHLTPAQDVL